MVYEADTLRDTLFTNWALTNRLSKEAAANQPRPIYFFARDQVYDKIETKAIEVKKLTSLRSKRKTEFFTTETDRFAITCRYKLQGTNRADWDISESDVEDMETEVQRIIDTVYQPQTGIGVFFTSDFIWDNQDQINDEKQDPIIVRVLTIDLTRIISRLTTVFDSFQRGVFFDLSASSNMTTPPLGDYFYTEVFDIESFEGFGNSELQVVAHPDGKGVPLLFSTGFKGTLIMKSYFKDTDQGTTADKVNQIYKRQANGEHPEIALVRTFTNFNSQTLTKTSILRIIELRETEPISNILTWQMIGKIIKPSVWSVA